MNSAEEKAREYANETTLVGHEYSYADVLREKKKSYVQGATDQDPISRSDERKKVIDKAIKFMVKLELFGCEDSMYAEQFKQAMEE